MFKDEAVIYVQSGRGGDGCISFRHEKYVPRGGPDGGDGGRGGNVILVPSRELASLAELHGRQRFLAESGRPGEGAKRHGRDGRNLSIRVPLGTIVRDHERGHLLKDLSTEGDFVVVRGGRGGRGNVHFASSTNRTPRRAQSGAPGQERWLALELKLIADVGLIGLPNAGKSTLLSRISRARPRVAPYPFTTLEPHLGILELDYRSIVVADLPGLIPGAHRGQGLGDRFLRHIERTRLLVHLIDGADPTRGLAESHALVRRELELYSPLLAGKPEIVAVTKLDAVSDRGMLHSRATGLPGSRHDISAVSGEGLGALIGTIAAALESIQDCSPHGRDPASDPL